MDSGKYCLDDFQGKLGKTGAPAVVDSWTCNGTGPQQWSWHTNNGNISYIEVQGQCLDVYRSGTANGTKVDLFPCNGGLNQEWQRYGKTIVSLLAPDKCLDAPASKPEVQLDIWTCNFGENQYWTDTTYEAGTTSTSTSSSSTSSSSASSTTPLPYCNADYSNKPCWPQPPTTAPANPFTAPVSTSSSSASTGTTPTTTTTPSTDTSSQSAASTASNPTQSYQTVLTSGVSGQCLDDSNNGSTTGNSVDSYSCNGTGAQNWTVTTSSTNASVHQLTVNGMCMKAANGGTAAGDRVDLAPCSTASTFWAQVGNNVEDNATTTGAHLCLTNTSTGSSSGTQLTVATCNGSASQAWELPTSASAAARVATTSGNTVLPTAPVSVASSFWSNIVSWFQTHL